MRTLLLVAVLLLPVVASTQQPTVEQMYEAYRQAGWVGIQLQDGAKFVCIPAQKNDAVDSIVLMIAHRAQGAQCS